MSHAISPHDIRGWAGELDQVHARLGSHFVRREPRQRVRSYRVGLLRPVARKNSWQLAEQAGEPTPTGMQRVLSGARWDVDAVRDELRTDVVAPLGDPDGVLICSSSTRPAF